MNKNYGSFTPSFKLIALAVIGLILLIVGFKSFSIVDTDANHQSVLVDRPLFFGQGGVRTETFGPGRQYTWSTTSAYQIDMNPFTLNENFDNLTTKDGSYVDFSTAITMQITNPVEYHKIGNKWYANQLQRVYQEIMRREVVQHSLTSLRTDNTTQQSIEKSVRSQVEDSIARLKLPVRLVDISLGRAMPNSEVQRTIDEATMQQQRKSTLKDAQAAEEQRAATETARAAADNAYRNALGLSSEQFIQLEQVKQFAVACKTAQNCTLLNGVGNPVVVK